MTQAEFDGMGMLLRPWEAAAVLGLDTRRLRDLRKERPRMATKLLGEWRYFKGEIAALARLDYRYPSETPLAVTDLGLEEKFRAVLEPMLAAWETRMHHGGTEGTEKMGKGKKARREPRPTLVMAEKRDGK